MSKLTSEAKGVKGAIVSALLSASYAFITARRVAAGVSLLHALQAPTAVQRVVAAATVAVLAPVYALAQKLVFSKVSLCVFYCCVVPLSLLMLLMVLVCAAFFHSLLLLCYC